MILIAGHMKPWSYIRYPSCIEVFEDRIVFIDGTKVRDCQWSQVRRVSVFRRRRSSITQMRLTFGRSESLLAAIRYMAFGSKEGEGPALFRMACDSEMDDFADLVLRVTSRVDPRPVSNCSLLERAGTEI